MTKKTLFALAALGMIGAVVGIDQVADKAPKREARAYVEQANRIMNTESNSARYLHLQDLDIQVDKLYNFRHELTDSAASNAVYTHNLVRNYIDFARTHDTGVPRSR